MTGDVFPCALRRQDCLVGTELSRRMMLDARRGRCLATADATADLAIATPSTAHALSTLLDDADREGGKATKPRHTTCSRSQELQAHAVDNDDATLSYLESVIITCPPVFEALLLHLPTLSLLGLYHTSRALRYFLRSYPLAWRTLSFRQLANDLNTPIPSSGSQSPDAITGASRPNALDLLFRVILPFGTRLTRLDLDNTAVSGSELYARILDQRRATLQHLSVRNCKNVSLKYHLLPFLQVQISVPRDSFHEPPLALKSLYAFRCRHHRRRPYLPSSLSRRDSESHPTHQFVQTCHYLGIWTDTGWCTTPGPRCFKRRDYAAGRVAADSKAEIWVPFDRLWRSQNIIGRCEPIGIPEVHGATAVGIEPGISAGPPRVARNGRLWEELEYGYLGEALGAGISTPGEGKEVPGHLRKSHTMFVEGFECHSCGDKIQERCEECSIRMHCVGCRKTLCASCAFDKPLRSKPRKKMHENAVLHALNSLGTADVLPPLASGDIESKMNRRTGTRLWWAPGATRSPNKISEFSSDDEDDSDHNDQSGSVVHGHSSRPVEPQITTKWCCQRLDISGGGGVSSPGIFHKGTSVRAAPLPAGQGFEDPSFHRGTESGRFSETRMTLSDEDDSYHPFARPSSNPSHANVRGPWKTRKIQPFSTVPYIEHAAREGGSAYSIKTFPRNLCKTCYESPGWKVRCTFKECHVGLCIEHDIKTLQVRQCGLRRLSAERRALRGNPPQRYFYAKWRPVAQDLHKYNFKGPRGAQPASNAISGAKETLSSHDPPSPRLSARSEYSKLASPIRGRNTPSPQRLNDNSTSRRRSLSVGRCHSADAEHPKPVASQSSARDDNAISTPFAKSAQLHRNNSIHHAQGFTGCSRLFCMAPDDRMPSDSRPNCPCWEYLAKCRECGVYACFDCAGMEMGCTCSACSLGWRNFQCPGCRGDWKTGEQVKHITRELVARGERWKAEDRSHRFWRCRLEAETQARRDVETPHGKTEQEVERERGALFSELPGDAPEDVYDNGNDGSDNGVAGLFGTLAATQVPV